MTENAPIDSAFDEQIRQMISRKLATLSPEAGRAWAERMLTQLTRTEIEKPDDDGEQG